MARNDDGDGIGAIRESHGARRCRSADLNRQGAIADSVPDREPNMPADLLRALFGNVTMPDNGLFWSKNNQHARATALPCAGS
jgi:hypothetical protein